MASESAPHDSIFFEKKVDGNLTIESDRPHREVETVESLVKSKDESPGSEKVFPSLSLTKDDIQDNYRSDYFQTKETTIVEVEIPETVKQFQKGEELGIVDDQCEKSEEEKPDRYGNKQLHNIEERSTEAEHREPRFDIEGGESVGIVSVQSNFDLADELRGIEGIRTSEKSGTKHHIDIQTIGEVQEKTESTPCERRKEEVTVEKTDEKIHGMLVSEVVNYPIHEGDTELSLLQQNKLEEDILAHRDSIDNKPQETKNSEKDESRGPEVDENNLVSPIKQIPNTPETSLKIAEDDGTLNPKLEVNVTEELPNVPEEHFKNIAGDLVLNTEVEVKGLNKDDDKVDNATISNIVLVQTETEEVTCSRAEKSIDLVGEVTGSPAITTSENLNNDDEIVTEAFKEKNIDSVTPNDTTLIQKNSDEVKSIETEKIFDLVNEVEKIATSDDSGIEHEIGCQSGGKVPELIKPIISEEQKETVTVVNADDKIHSRELSEIVHQAKQEGDTNHSLLQKNEEKEYPETLLKDSLKRNETSTAREESRSTTDGKEGEEGIQHKEHPHDACAQAKQAAATAESSVDEILIEKIQNRSGGIDTGEIREELHEEGNASPSALELSEAEAIQHCHESEKNVEVLKEDDRIRETIEKGDLNALSKESIKEGVINSKDDDHDAQKSEGEKSEVVKEYECSPKESNQEHNNPDKLVDGFPLIRDVGLLQQDQIQAPNKAPTEENDYDENSSIKETGLGNDNNDEVEVTEKSEKVIFEVKTDSEEIPNEVSGEKAEQFQEIRTEEVQIDAVGEHAKEITYTKEISEKGKEKEGTTTSVQLDNETGKKVDSEPKTEASHSDINKENLEEEAPTELDSSFTVNETGKKTSEDDNGEAIKLKEEFSLESKEHTEAMHSRVERKLNLSLGAAEPQRDHDPLRTSETSDEENHPPQNMKNVIECCTSVPEVSEKEIEEEIRKKEEFIESYSISISETKNSSVAEMTEKETQEILSKAESITKDSNSISTLEKSSFMPELSDKEIKQEIVIKEDNAASYLSSISMTENSSSVSEVGKKETEKILEKQEPIVKDGTQISMLEVTAAEELPNVPEEHFKNVTGDLAFNTEVEIEGLNKDDDKVDNATISNIVLVQTDSEGVTSSTAEKSIDPVGEVTVSQTITTSENLNNDDDIVTEAIKEKNINNVTPNDTTLIQTNSDEAKSIETEKIVNIVSELKEIEKDTTNDKLGCKSGGKVPEMIEPIVSEEQKESVTVVNVGEDDKINSRELSDFVAHAEQEGDTDHSLLQKNEQKEYPEMLLKDSLERNETSTAREEFTSTTDSKEVEEGIQHTEYPCDACPQAKQAAESSVEDIQIEKMHIGSGDIDSGNIKEELLGGNASSSALESSEAEAIKHCHESEKNVEILKEDERIRETSEKSEINALSMEFIREDVINSVDDNYDAKKSKGEKSEVVKEYECSPKESNQEHNNTEKLVDDLPLKRDEGLPQQETPTKENDNDENSSIKVTGLGNDNYDEVEVTAKSKKVIVEVKTDSEETPIEVSGEKDEQFQEILTEKVELDALGEHAKEITHTEETSETVEKKEGTTNVQLDNETEKEVVSEPNMEASHSDIQTENLDKEATAEPSFTVNETGRKTSEDDIGAAIKLKEEFSLESEEQTEAMHLRVETKLDPAGASEPQKDHDALRTSETSDEENHPPQNTKNVIECCVSVPEVSKKAIKEGIQRKEEFVNNYSIHISSSVAETSEKESEEILAKDESITKESNSISTLETSSPMPEVSDKEETENISEKEEPIVKDLNSISVTEERDEFGLKDEKEENKEQVKSFDHPEEKGSSLGILDTHLTREFKLEEDKDISTFSYDGENTTPEPNEKFPSAGVEYEKVIVVEANLDPISDENLRPTTSKELEDKTVEASKRLGNKTALMDQTTDEKAETIFTEQVTNSESEDRSVNQVGHYELESLDIGKGDVREETQRQGNEEQCMTPHEINRDENEQKDVKTKKELNDLEHQNEGPAKETQKHENVVEHQPPEHRTDFELKEVGIPKKEIIDNLTDENQACELGTNEDEIPITETSKHANVPEGDKDILEKEYTVKNSQEKVSDSVTEEATFTVKAALQSLEHAGASAKHDEEEVSTTTTSEKQEARELNLKGIETVKIDSSKRTEEETSKEYSKEDQVYKADKEDQSTHIEKQNLKDQPTVEISSLLKSGVTVIDTIREESEVQLLNLELKEPTGATDFVGEVKPKNLEDVILSSNVEVLTPTEKLDGDADTEKENIRLITSIVSKVPDKEYKELSTNETNYIIVRAEGEVNTKEAEQENRENKAVTNIKEPSDIEIKLNKKSTSEEENDDTTEIEAGKSRKKVENEMEEKTPATEVFYERNLTTFEVPLEAKVKSNIQESLESPLKEHQFTTVESSKTADETSLGETTHGYSEIVNSSTEQIMGEKPEDVSILEQSELEKKNAYEEVQKYGPEKNTGEVLNIDDLDSVHTEDIIQIQHDGLKNTNKDFSASAQEEKAPAVLEEDHSYIQEAANNENTNLFTENLESNELCKNLQSDAELVAGASWDRTSPESSKIKKEENYDQDHFPRSVEQTQGKQLEESELKMQYEVETEIEDKEVHNAVKEDGSQDITQVIVEKNCFNDVHIVPPSLETTQEGKVAEEFLQASTSNEQAETTNSEDSLSTTIGEITAPKLTGEENAADKLSGTPVNFSKTETASFELIQEGIKEEVDISHNKADFATADEITSDSSFTKSQMDMPVEAFNSCLDDASSDLESQLPNVNVKQIGIVNSDPNKVEEIKSLISPVFVFENETLKETDETQESLRVEKQETDELRDAVQVATTSRCLDVEPIIEGEVTSHLTLPAEKSKDKLHTPFSASPSNEQTSMDAKTEELDIQVHENLNVQKEEAIKLESSEGDLSTKKEFHISRSSEVHEECRTLDEDTKLEPPKREEIPYVDSLLESEEVTKKIIEETPKLQFETTGEYNSVSEISECEKGIREENETKKNPLVEKSDINEIKETSPVAASGSRLSHELKPVLEGDISAPDIISVGKFEETKPVLPSTFPTKELEDGTDKKTEESINETEMDIQEDSDVSNNDIKLKVSDSEVAPDSGSQINSSDETHEEGHEPVHVDTKSEPSKRQEIITAESPSGMKEVTEQRIEENSDFQSETRPREIEHVSKVSDSEEEGIKETDETQKNLNVEKLELYGTKEAEIESISEDTKSDHTERQLILVDSPPGSQEVVEPPIEEASDLHFKTRPRDIEHVAEASESKKEDIEEAGKDQKNLTMEKLDQDEVKEAGTEAVFKDPKSESSERREIKIADSTSRSKLVTEKPNEEASDLQFETKPREIEHALKLDEPETGVKEAHETQQNLKIKKLDLDGIKEDGIESLREDTKSDPSKRHEKQVVDSPRGSKEVIEKPIEETLDLQFKTFGETKHVSKESESEKKGIEEADEAQQNLIEEKLDLEEVKESGIETSDLQFEKRSLEIEHVSKVYESKIEGIIKADETQQNLDTEKLDLDGIKEAGHGSISDDTKSEPSKRQEIQVVESPPESEVAVKPIGETSDPQLETGSSKIQHTSELSESEKEGVKEVDEAQQNLIVEKFDLDKENEVEMSVDTKSEHSKRQEIQAADFPTGCKEETEKPIEHDLKVSKFEKEDIKEVDETQKNQNLEELNLDEVKEASQIKPKSSCLEVEPIIEGEISAPEASTGVNLDEVQISSSTLETHNIPETHVVDCISESREMEFEENKIEEKSIMQFERSARGIEHVSEAYEYQNQVVKESDASQQSLIVEKLKQHEMGEASQVSMSLVVEPEDGITTYETIPKDKSKKEQQVASPTLPPKEQEHGIGITTQKIDNNKEVDDSLSVPNEEATELKVAEVGLIEIKQDQDEVKETSQIASTSECLIFEPVLEDETTAPQILSVKKSEEQLQTAPSLTSKQHNDGTEIEVKKTEDKKEVEIQGHRNADDQMDAPIHTEISDEEVKSSTEKQPESSAGLHDDQGRTLDGDTKSEKESDVVNSLEEREKFTENVIEEPLVPSLETSLKAINSVPEIQIQEGISKFENTENKEKHLKTDITCLPTQEDLLKEKIEPNITREYTNSNEEVPRQQKEVSYDSPSNPLDKEASRVSSIVNEDVKTSELLEKAETSEQNIQHIDGDGSVEDVRNNENFPHEADSKDIKERTAIDFEDQGVDTNTAIETKLTVSPPEKKLEQGIKTFQSEGNTESAEIQNISRDVPQVEETAHEIYEKKPNQTEVSIWKTETTLSADIEEVQIDTIAETPVKIEGQETKPEKTIAVINEVEYGEETTEEIKHVEEIYDTKNKAVEEADKSQQSLTEKRLDQDEVIASKSKCLSFEPVIEDEATAPQILNVEKSEEQLETVPSVPFKQQNDGTEIEAKKTEAEKEVETHVHRNADDLLDAPTHTEVLNKEVKLSTETQPESSAGLYDDDQGRTLDGDTKSEKGQESEIVNSLAEREKFTEKVIEEPLVLSHETNLEVTNCVPTVQIQEEILKLDNTEIKEKHLKTDITCLRAEEDQLEGKNEPKIAGEYMYSNAKVPQQKKEISFDSLSTPLDKEANRVSSIVNEDVKTSEVLEKAETSEQNDQYIGDGTVEDVRNNENFPHEADSKDFKERTAIDFEDQGVVTDSAIETKLIVSQLEKKPEQGIKMLKSEGNTESAEIQNISRDVPQIEETAHEIYEKKLYQNIEEVPIDTVVETPVKIEGQETKPEKTIAVVKEEEYGEETTEEVKHVEEIYDTKNKAVEEVDKNQQSLTEKKLDQYEVIASKSKCLSFEPVIDDEATVPQILNVEKSEEKLETVPSLPFKQQNDGTEIEVKKTETEKEVEIHVHRNADDLMDATTHTEVLNEEVKSSIETHPESSAGLNDYDHGRTSDGDTKSEKGQEWEIVTEKVIEEPLVLSLETSLEATNSIPEVQIQEDISKFGNTEIKEKQLKTDITCFRAEEDQLEGKNEPNIAGEYTYSNAEVQVAQQKEEEVSDDTPSTPLGEEANRESSIVNEDLRRAEVLEKAETSEQNDQHIDGNENFPHEAENKEDQGVNTNSAIETKVAVPEQIKKPEQGIETIQSEGSTESSEIQKTSSEIPQVEVTTCEISTGNEEAPIYKINESTIRIEEETKEQSITADWDKVSLADLINKSTKESLDAGKAKAIAIVGEKKEVDEEKEQKENDRDSGSDAPVIIEQEVPKEIDVKSTHKKSHNILSGVGSKVKHSISKVKKAITGKSSSHQKPHSPK